MVRALIIGCGGIGGLYDIDNNKIETHAKAICINNWIDEVDVFDTNVELQNRICLKYGFNALELYKKKQYSNYDIVCISSPTDTHFQYLKACIESKVPIIICEKPVSNSIEELDEIKNLYDFGKSKIIVNYFRRFLTSYLHLKRRIKLKKNELKEIEIKYYKGFLNNCGHALDIIEFLTDSKLNPSNVKVLNREYDFFDSDPTLTVNFISNDVKFFIRGFNINHSIFEIYLKFEYQEIFLKQRGNKIEVYEDSVLHFESDNLLKDYMKDVYNEVKNVYFDNELNDNFTNSIILNRTQLNNFM